MRNHRSSAGDPRACSSCRGLAPGSRDVYRSLAQGSIMPSSSSGSRSPSIVPEPPPVHTPDRSTVPSDNIGTGRSGSASAAGGPFAPPRRRPSSCAPAASGTLSPKIVIETRKGEKSLRTPVLLKSSVRCKSSLRSSSAQVIAALVVTPGANRPSSRRKAPARRTSRSNWQWLFPSRHVPPKPPTVIRSPTWRVFRDHPPRSNERTLAISKFQDVTAPFSPVLST